MLTVTINSVDKTSDILWQSFRISDYINQQVDVCTFECINFKPLLNQEVRVSYDGNSIYGGVIVKIESNIKKGYTQYSITCKDYTQYLNRELVSESFVNKTPKEIIDSLIAEYATDFTDTNVPSTILEGRVAYYKLDGNSTDEVASNNGSDTAITYVAGKINTCANFNGSAKIDIGAVVIPTGAKTVSFWFKSSDVTNNYGVISTGEIFSANKNGFNVSGGNWTGGKLYFQVGRVGGELLTIQTSANVCDGVFRLFTFTWNGTTGANAGKLYINGVLNNQATATQLETDTPLHNLIIGDDPSASNFTGNLDELGIWNRALTQAEITELYNSASGITFPFNYPLISSITFNRLNVSQCIEALANTINYYWYVDYEKDIHFFAENDEVAPFNLTETGEKHAWESLRIVEDFSQIRNQIYVIGGEYEGEARVESYVADGTQLQFPLAYKYSSLSRVRIVGGADLTVGIDGEDTEANFQVFWSPKQKYLRFKTSNKPTAGQVMEVTGLPLFQVFVKVPDVASITQYGLYEFKIKDTSITSRADAIARGVTELQSYADSLDEASFITDTYGLRSGQTININIAGTNEDFIIQSVSMNMKSPLLGKWSIKLATVKTLGIIRFLQKYLKIEDEIVEGETLLELQQFTDESADSDSVDSITTHTSQDYYWGDDTVHAYDSYWDFSTYD